MGRKEDAQVGGMDCVSSLSLSVPLSLCPSLSLVPLLPFAPSCPSCSSVLFPPVLSTLLCFCQIKCHVCFQSMYPLLFLLVFLATPLHSQVNNITRRHMMDMVDGSTPIEAVLLGAKNKRGQRPYRRQKKRLPVCSSVKEGYYFPCQIGLCSYHIIVRVSYRTSMSTWTRSSCVATSMIIIITVVKHRYR